jgi:hypothetical protein
LSSATDKPVNVAAAWGLAVMGVCLAAYMALGGLAYFAEVNDLPQYYAASWMLLHGQASQIYDLPSLFAAEKTLFSSRPIALFVPPPAVLLFALLAFLPIEAAPLAWTLILATALGLSIWLLARWLNLGRLETLGLIGLLTLSGPTVEALRLGQLAPLMLLALVVSARLATIRPALAGIALAALVFKPQQLLPMLVFFIAARRRTLVVASLSFLFALLVLSLIVFGQSGFHNYVSLVSNPLSRQYMQSELSPTVRGQLMRILGVNSRVPDLVAGVVLVLSLGLVAYLAHASRKNDNWLTTALLAALPLGLLTSVHCHDYDLLLMVPGLVLFLKTQLWKDMRAVRKVAFILGLTAFLPPFYNDIHYGYLLKGGSINPHFLLLFLFTVCMVAVAARSPDKLLPAQ